MSTSSRLSSVDALRGLTVAAMLLVNDAGDWSHVHPWLEHAAWHGIAPPDLIFPLFLFIVGVSIVLAFEPRLEAGAAPGPLARQAVGRGLRIVALGLALHLLAWFTLDPGRAFRVMGVLQRIGLCFTAAALVALYLRDARAQWALIAALLAGYAALLALGPLDEFGNLADRVDTALLGAHAYVWDAATGRAHDPEGVLSTLPAIATTLLGVRAGAWLRARQLRALVMAGAAGLLLGALWSLEQPLNKNLWTPSFVLWTGGFSMLALALAHRLIDVRHWPPLGRAFGVNAIAAYAGAWAAVCLLDASGAMAWLYPTLFARPLAAFQPWVPSAAYALAFTAAWWLLMAWLDRRRWRWTI